MKSKGSLESLIRPRPVLVMAAWLYAWTLHFAHVAYLNQVWEYYGFSYRNPSLLEVTLAISLITLGALVMPAVLNRASSVVLLLLFVVVYIPVIVISLGLDTNRLERYGPSLLMLGLAFAVACLAARRRLRSSPLADRVPDERFCKVVLAAWALCGAVLVYAYAPVMNFAGLDDIYEQRAAGASTNLLMGYLQTYFSVVLSPALIAIGLLKSRLRLVLLGSAGCLVMYMISAQRTVFLLPVAMIALQLLLRSQWPFLRSSAFVVLVLSASVAACAAYYAKSLVASLFSLFLVFRTLGLPGLTFSMYFDLFSADGFTWWSHIKGFDFLIPAPASFANDPSWPGLGYIVGDRIYNNVELNFNANLFSGDGVAAAGAFGVLVIGMVFAAWLALLDWTTRGWDRRFVILVVLPLALSLTNGHFFSMMLSFGGLFWLLVFHFFKPRQDRRRRRVHVSPDSVAVEPP